MVHEMLNCTGQGQSVKHCSKTFTAAEAKVKQLRDHILYHCPDVPKDIREQWEHQAAKGCGKSMSGEKAVAAGVKRTRQSDIRRALPSRDCSFLTVKCRR